MKRTRTALWSAALVTGLLMITGCTDPDKAHEPDPGDHGVWAQNAWNASSLSERRTYCSRYRKGSPQVIRVPSYGDEEALMEEFMQVIRKMC